MNPVVIEFKREKKLMAIILAPMTIFYLYDLLKDWSGGAHASHLAFEICSVILGIGLTSWLWISSLNKAHNINRTLHKELCHKSDESLHWRLEASSYIKGLSIKIDEQFDKWKLSPAEKEIGLLILKGLSNKEIADVRTTSERTVKEQASSIYQKAGLSSRAQLSAFFLEDLLLPINAH